MDLLTLLFRLPFLPLQGVIKLAELIQEEAERELYDPARVRHELEEVEERRERGEISDEEMARTEDEITTSLVSEPEAPPRGQQNDDRS